MSQEVAPGGIVDLSVNFTAPGVPGTHRSTWQLRTPDGTLFGSKPYLQIVVPAEAPTPTATPTSVPVAAGESESGVTIHLVDADYDTGPILAQATVPLQPGDSAEEVAARVLKTEHTFFSETLQRIAKGDIKLPD